MSAKRGALGPPSNGFQITIWRAACNRTCQGCGRRSFTEGAGHCHFVNNLKFKTTDILCHRCIDVEVELARRVGGVVVDKRQAASCARFGKEFVADDEDQ